MLETGAQHVLLRFAHAPVDMNMPPNYITYQNLQPLANQIRNTTILHMGTHWCSLQYQAHRHILYSNKITVMLSTVHVQNFQIYFCAFSSPDLEIDSHFLIPYEKWKKNKNSKNYDHWKEKQCGIGCINVIFKPKQIFHLKTLIVLVMPKVWLKQNMIIRSDYLDNHTSLF